MATGLLGILQHPAMIYHPPILYLGLTVLVVPAAFTIESVKLGEVDKDWVVGARRWLVISWTFLTLGMVAGASWAYIELGWGGFWAWDPVENTALMPWLAITAFLHTSRIQERDGRARRLNVFLSLAAFTLTVLGVYLTRSGSTGSIHAFAEDPVIGRVLVDGSPSTADGQHPSSWRSHYGRQRGEAVEPDLRPVQRHLVGGQHAGLMLTSTHIHRQSVLPIRPSLQVFADYPALGRLTLLHHHHLSAFGLCW